MHANTSVNNWPKRYHIRFHIFDTRLPKPSSPVHDLHLSIWHLLLFRFTSPWYSLPLSLVNKEPSPRRLREYIRLLYKSSCPHGPSTSKTYSCYFTNASHIPHFHALPVTSTDIIWRDGQTLLGHSFGGYLHKFHSWYARDQCAIPGEKCPCMFAFCGVGWRCLSLARPHVSVDAHACAWLPNGRATAVIVKCSSKTPPLDPSSKRRMSAVILLPPLPCKIASPRGLSVTPWGFTTHTHKPLSLAMLPTFTPNSNPNQPCFYLSDLSSPIFSFYILFI